MTLTKRGPGYEAARDTETQDQHQQHNDDDRNHYTCYRIRSVMSSAMPVIAASVSAIRAFRAQLRAISR